MVDRILHLALAALVAPATAQLRVTEPASLAHEFEDTEGVVYGSLAAAADRGPVRGYLRYCESKTGSHHCSEEDYDQDAEAPGVVSDGPMPPEIFLVEAGSCPFAQKVLVAQARGARAVVVVDDSAASREQIGRTELNASAGVTIPSVLVCQEDGRRLIAAAQAELVLVEFAMEAHLPHELAEPARHSVVVPALGVVCVIALVWYLYRRYLRNKLKSDIREEVMMEVQMQISDDYVQMVQGGIGKQSGGPSLAF